MQGNFHSHRRFDWFIIHDPVQNDDQHGIQQSKIGQVLLFFEIDQNDKKLSIGMKDVSLPTKRQGCISWIEPSS
jgi:hypothetical protein